MVATILARFILIYAPAYFSCANGDHDSGDDNMWGGFSEHDAGHCMRLGIMQPYFMPYIGYWQLLAMVDTFVVYDNIQYTKKGWINRNRFLQNGKDYLFTIPVKKDSEFLDVVQRSVADDFNRDKLLNQLEASYRKAPFFKTVFPIVTSIIRAEHRNLFDYIYHSVRVTADFLEIKTPIVISSSLAIDHSLRGENKVLAICKAMGATTYVNAIGGQELYSKSSFDTDGIGLKFIKTRPIGYPQHSGTFVPNLSIIDVMMFNSKESIRAMLGEYDLVGLASDQAGVEEATWQKS